MRSFPLWVKLLGGIGTLAAACVGLTFVPTGEVAYAPIAPIDLDGKVSVDGRAVEPLQGRMYLVGVTERKVNLLERLLLDVSDPSIDFGPEPEGRSVGGPAQADVRSMDEAKQVSAGVAFDLAKQPVQWVGTGATVAAVDPNGPAARVLRGGDLIRRVNGTPVDTSVDAGRAIHRLPPRSRVTIGLQRAGVASEVTLRTVAPPPGSDGTRQSLIGVDLSTIGLRVVLPRDVGIDSGEVVGPSAGLAFALYLVDALSTDDLLQGRNVVATGALSPDGQVLPVGRMRQKAIASQVARRDLLLVPAANAEEARKAVAQACEAGSGCVGVVPVRSAQEAVELLRLPDAELARKVAAGSP